MAIAASLALLAGLSAGLLLSPGGSETDAPMLSAAVHEQLGTLPSDVKAGLPDGRRVRVVASFTDGAGAFCREYETAASGRTGYVGVACREWAEWSLRFAMATDSARTAMHRLHQWRRLTLSMRQRARHRRSRQKQSVNISTRTRLRATHCRTRGAQCHEARDTFIDVGGF